METLILSAVGLGVLFVFFMVAASLRKVVSTNEVHIVQSAKSTTSYGKDTGHGNTYYAFPSWLPFIGITTITFPTSVFDLRLHEYEAYDKGRLPFHIDIVAFFRITESNVAAQRVASFKELQDQLTSIVQGAVRTILASHDIEEILQSRSIFGEKFTHEVTEQLSNWGVGTVKNLELMDIRDSKGSAVIANIMEKRKSFIQMESRTEVAKNNQAAAIAEIEAKKEVDLQNANAVQVVGLRKVEAERLVELQNQSKSQAVKEQERVTKEKEMAVLSVAAIKQAEITKEVTRLQSEQNKTNAIITAQANNESQVLNAETSKKTATLIAEGKFEAQKRQAEGDFEVAKREASATELIGLAKATAEKALLLAPVEAQTTLAKEIGQNESYQKYLTSLRQIEAQQAIGVAQAGALSKAEIKIISNTDSPTTGLNNVMDLFSSKGGTQVGAMLEGLANTDKGKALLDVAGLGKKDKMNGAAQ